VYVVLSAPDESQSLRADTGNMPHFPLQTIDRTSHLIGKIYIKLLMQRCTMDVSTCVPAKMSVLSLLGVLN
jgi:hypothetical protein